MYTGNGNKTTLQKGSDGTQSQCCKTHTETGTLAKRLSDDPSLMRKLQATGERMSAAIGASDSVAYYNALLDLYEQGEANGA